MTASGRYWFTKRPSVAIRSHTRDDVPAILALGTSCFGYGYLDPESLHSSTNTVGIVAETSRDFAGFCLGEILSQRKFRDALQGAASEAIPDNLAYASRKSALGMVKTVAVTEAHRNHGVATDLLARAEAELSRKGATSVIVPAWRRDGDVPVASVLRRANYVEWCTIEKYWKQDCDLGKFSCIARNGEFTCDLVFFRKSLTRQR